MRRSRPPHRYRSAAPFHVVGTAPVGQSGCGGAEPVQGGAHTVGEAVGMAGDAHVRVAPVVDHPGQVTRRERGVEDAVERGGLLAGRHGEEFLGPDQQPAVAVQGQVVGDPRPGSVGAHEEPCAHAGRPVRTVQQRGAQPSPGVPGAQRDPHPGLRRGARRGQVERAHVAHLELVPRAVQGHRSSPIRRIEDHAPDRRSEAPLRQREVVERLADEDPRGADRRREAGAPVDQQHVPATPGEFRGGVQTGQPGAHDQHVDVLRKVAHRFASSRRSRRPPSRRAAPAQERRTATEDVVVIPGTSPRRRYAAPVPGSTSASQVIHV